MQFMMEKYTPWYYMEIQKLFALFLYFWIQKIMFLTKSIFPGKNSLFDASSLKYTPPYLL